MSLYILVLFFSAIIPLSLSFDKKVHFHTTWKYTIPAIFFSAVVFIIIDIIFTRNGIWGFNPRHNLGIIIAGIPVEEYLFFILVPYSCLFIHYVYLSYAGQYSISDKYVRTISIILIVFLMLISIIHQGRTYTVIYSLFTAGILVLFNLFDRNRILNSYFITWFIMLIPFLIVNAILTGAFTTEEVVWYNNNEIMGIRVLTIPVEDFFYFFSLIGLNLFIAENLKSKKARKSLAK